MMKRTNELLTREQWAKRIGKLSPGDVLPEVPPMVKFFQPKITPMKDIDPETGMRDIKFVISTGTIDRDDDIIDVNGWDIENYKSNPVVLWVHDYWSPPVAQATEVGIEDDKLVAIDRFTPKETYPFGHMIYQMVAGKFLRATSVGFKPKQYVFNDEHKGYDFSAQELLEHSIVPVPSNPEALEAASAAGIDLMPLKLWAEKILDDDPEKDRVALWLPKNTVEIVYAALSNVAVSLADTTSTSIIPDDVLDLLHGGTSITAPQPLTVADININLEPSEEVMEKAIQALTDVIKELRDALDTLPEMVAAAVEAKLAEAITKTPEKSGEELTEEDIKAIIASAVSDVLTATTGALPD
jgi:HK97 family phage prohead protease